MTDASQPSALVASNLMLVEIIRKLVVGDVAKDPSPVDSKAASDLAAAGREIEQLKKSVELSDREVTRLNRALLDQARSQYLSVSAPAVLEAVIDTRNIFKASQAKPNLECAVVPVVLSGTSKPVQPEPNEKPAPLGGQHPAPPAGVLGPMSAVEGGPEFTLPVIPKNRSCIVMGKEIISRLGRHTCTKANTAKMVGKLGGGGTHFIGHLARDYGFGDEAKARSALVGLEDHLRKIGLQVSMNSYEAWLSLPQSGDE